MALQFSDTATKQGIIQECEYLVFGDNGYGRISGDTNLLATFTRLTNEALNSIASLIMQSDNRWQWDDINDTDFPVATTNLVTTLNSEQQDYSFDVTFLKILRVEVLDSAGNWTKLQPIDQSDIYDQSLTDFLKTAGQPLYYDKVGNSVFLYPKPLATAVTSANGLKVYFQRPPSYFTASDTTKQPGFNSLYHRLVALKASFDYAMVNSLDVVGSIPTGKGLAYMVETAETKLVEDYALRNKDEHIKLSVKQMNFR
jgi:hypothetical protein